MGHGPATEWKKDNSSRIKSRLGLWMFFVYLLVYIGFVLINVLNPKLMEIDVGSLNLAIVYGFTLIIFALILAFVYNFVCTRLEEKLNKDDEDINEGAGQ